MRKANQMMCKTIEARVGAFLAGMLLSFVALAADSAPAISSLVIPKDGEARNPPTEIAVMNGSRIRNVMDRLGGMDCVPGRAAWNVLGIGQSVAEWAASEGYDAREAKGALLGAISLLTKAYGYA